MRRQAANSRVTPAGSGRVERLDPFALPLRFHDVDETADQRVRLVELHRERVVLRRTLRGIKMAVNLAVSAYQGVVIRLEPSAPKLSPKSWSKSSPEIAVVLEHRDRALSLTLCRAPDGSDIVAQWRCWGRALGVPLLVEEADGSLREPFERMGRLSIGTPWWRRRSRTALSSRRSSMALRRGRGAMARHPDVHSEREIIARN